MSIVSVQRCRQSLVDSRVLTVLIIVASASSLVVPAFVLRNAYTVTLPVSVLFAGLLGIYLQYQGPNNLEIPVTVEVPGKLLYSLWFVGLSLAIVLYVQSGFSRPLSVNLLMLFLYTLAIGAIITTSRNRLLLGLLLATGLVHRAFIYFANPLPYGVDPHYHYGNAHSIAQFGTLESLHTTKEFVAPFYHVMGAIGTLVLNLPVRQGTMFLVLVVGITVITTLLVYHITATLWNPQAGLIASVLFLAGDQQTGDLLALGTTEFGLVWFAIVLYAALWYLRTEGVRYLVVFLIAILALNFTHHGSMFVVSLSVVSFCVGAMLFRGLSARFVNLSLLSVMVLIVNWMSASLSGGQDSFFAWIVLSLVSRIELLWVVEGGGVRPEELGFIPAAEMAGSGYIDVLGMGLLFFFAVFGVLYWTAARADYTREFVILFGCVIGFLLALIFVGSVVGIDAVVPSRWFKHLYLLLAIPAGVGVIGLVSLVPKSAQKPSVLLLCVLVLTVPYLILMGVSFTATVDDPVFSDSPAAERMSYTDEEVETTEFAMDYAPAETQSFSDQFGYGPLRWDETITTVQQSRLTVNVDEGEIVRDSDRPTMVLNREYMYSGHAKFNVWTSDLGPQPALAVRGEAPLSPSVLDGYAKVHQAENGDCQATSCGIYLDDQ